MYVSVLLIIFEEMSLMCTLGGMADPDSSPQIYQNPDFRMIPVKLERTKKDSASKQKCLFTSGSQAVIEDVRSSYRSAGL